MRPWSRLFVAVAVAAGVGAFMLWRMSRQGPGPSVTHESVQGGGQGAAGERAATDRIASDRVRERLEQLRALRPGLSKAPAGAVQARSGVAAVAGQPGRGQGSGSDAAAVNAETQPADAPFDEDPDDIPTLKKMALEDTDPDRRLTAVTLLGASEDPDVVPVLAQALADKDSEVRLAALESLSDFTDEPPVEAIENALQDADADIRFEAVSILADIGGDRARGAVEKALNDPDEDVRNLAEGVLDLENLYESTPAAAAAAP